MVISGLNLKLTPWGGASEFLAFIRDQLIAFIDATYPTIPGDRAYFGHSLGGGFGLHALFSDAGVFSKYVISSPGISYDGDPYGIREAQEFIASGRPLSARLVMSVGEEEEFDRDVGRAQLVSSFYRLAALLRGCANRAFEFSCRVIPGGTHIDVWPIAFSHGVQAIYGPANHAPTAVP